MNFFQLPAPDVAVEVSDPVASPVGGYNLYPVQDSLCLLDAHLIFQPLLLSLGVIPQQMISNVGSSGKFKKKNFPS